MMTDRAHGGSSLVSGQLEVMLHRRLFNDDAFGVGEALNETAFGTGLVVRGQHRVMLCEVRLFSPKYVKCLLSNIIQSKKRLLIIRTQSSIVRLRLD